MKKTKNVRVTMTVAQLEAITEAIGEYIDMTDYTLRGTRHLYSPLHDKKDQYKNDLADAYFTVKYASRKA